MQPKSKKISLEYLVDVRKSMPPHYFEKINFTNDEIELLVWHFGNQKMQNKDENNSYSIFWNQVKFFKGFIHDFLSDDEDFWWNEHMCDAVRVFNSFNNQFLGKLFSEKMINDDFADKAAIAGWFYLVYEYAEIIGFRDQARTSFSDYEKIMMKYFQTDSHDAHNTIVLGLKEVREYINILKRQLELNENATKITWSQYLQNKQ